MINDNTFSSYNSNSNLSDFLLLRLNEKRYKNLLTNHGDINKSLDNFQKDKYFNLYLKHKFYQPSNNIIEEFSNTNSMNTIQQQIDSKRDESLKLHKQINNFQKKINYYNSLNSFIIGVLLLCIIIKLFHYNFHK